MMTNDVLADSPSVRLQSAAVRASTGFTPLHPGFHRVYNLTLSLSLFILILPLFLMISLALLSTQGSSIFYYGPRLGRGKKLFHIIKFRTLDGEKAKQLTRDGVLPPGSGIETPLGGFLRDTRLDELPQLLNVIGGTMNLCGPRPVRPEIAEIYRSEIANYDTRFDVKPGLVGHTQAYMNHGTSKFIRARYNALVIHSPVNYIHEISMLALVGSCVLARGLNQTWRAVMSKVTLRARKEGVERARALELSFQPNDADAPIDVVSFDENAIWLDKALMPGAEGASGRLSIRLPDGKMRFAQLKLSPPVLDGFGGAPGYAYVPSSEFAFHIVTRYALQKVVVPHKAHLPLMGAINAGIAALQWFLPRERFAGVVRQP